MYNAIYNTHTGELIDIAPTSKLDAARQAAVLETVTAQRHVPLRWSYQEALS